MPLLDQMNKGYIQNIMQPSNILVAKDGSKNFVWEFDEGQKMEARFVVRNPEELICYISSQSACARACRMCHLTRTGQVNARNFRLSEMLTQAEYVLDEIKPDNQFRIVNFNFMARGEPLDNPKVNSYTLFELGKLAKSIGLQPRFKISTIMPAGADLDLVDRFGMVQPDIYYSFYSVDPIFRKKWFPKAVECNSALSRLKEWQDFSHKIPRIHFALIAGENDSTASLEDLIATLRLHELRVDFNIVRYNPYDELSAEGNWELAQQILHERMPEARVQVVQRVGYEAKASCGMFVS